MQSILRGSLLVLSLALAPVAGSLLEQSCQGCSVSGNIPQADGTTISLGDGGVFHTSNIDGQEPSNASGSWDFDIKDPGKLELDKGVCGPMTPGPGCGGEACSLLCTDAFKVVLRDKQPDGGSSSPMPGPGWGPENNHKWTWQMDNGEVKLIACSTSEETCLDLSIDWTFGDAPKTYDLKFCCSACLEVGDPDE